MAELETALAAILAEARTQVAAGREPNVASLETRIATASLATPRESTSSRLLPDASSVRSCPSVEPAPVLVATPHPGRNLLHRAAVGSPCGRNRPSRAHSTSVEPRARVTSSSGMLFQR